jgi:O-methyltransferase
MREVPETGETARETVVLPGPAVPWTERLHRLSPRARKRILTAWESLPRQSDLAHPRSYLEALRLHHLLFVQDYTMLYPLRGRALFHLAREMDRRRVVGALVDCGTYKGGSTALLSAASPEREVWAFDSFEGLPEPSERDVNHEMGEEERRHYVGLCLGSEEALREAVSRYGNPARLNIRKGWFEDTLGPASEEIGPIALLHCDSDWYDSVRVTLDNLYPLVGAGGVIVIDDYGACPGAGQATRDFKASVDDNAPLVNVDQSGAYWFKPGTA